MNDTDKEVIIEADSRVVIAWQDKDDPNEIVSAEDWENIDPIWHWMYRPLYK